MNNSCLPLAASRWPYNISRVSLMSQQLTYTVKQRTYKWCWAIPVKHLKSVHLLPGHCFGKTFHIFLCLWALWQHFFRCAFLIQFWISWCTRVLTILYNVFGPFSPCPVIPFVQHCYSNDLYSKIVLSVVLCNSLSHTYVFIKPLYSILDECSYQFFVVCVSLATFPFTFFPKK